MGLNTQQDPIGIAGGLNLYGYANGDPINFRDPFGLCPVCIFEIGASIFDAVDLGLTALRTFRGEASGAALSATAGGFFLGLAAPGGGYGRVAREAAERLDDLSAAARSLGDGGLSAAGRALAKHRDRAGTAFRFDGGGPADLNAAAQGIVDDILTAPSSVFTARHHARFGNVLEVRDATGRGLRYGESGDFIGFLEPNR